MRFENLCLLHMYWLMQFYTSRQSTMECSCNTAYRRKYISYQQIQDDIFMLLVIYVLLGDVALRVRNPAYVYIIEIRLHPLKYFLNHQMLSAFIWATFWGVVAEWQAGQICNC